MKSRLTIIFIELIDYFYNRLFPVLNAVFISILDFYEVNLIIFFFKVVL